MAMENNYLLHANTFSNCHFGDHNDTERHWNTIIYDKDYTVLNSKTCASKRRKFPWDDQTDTSLKHHLQCISRDLKLLWKVFSMYLGGNHHWVPLSSFLVTWPKCSATAVHCCVESLMLAWASPPSVRRRKAFKWSHNESHHPCQSTSGVPQINAQWV